MAEQYRRGINGSISKALLRISAMKSARHENNNARAGGGARSHQRQRGIG